MADAFVDRHLRYCDCPDCPCAVPYLGPAAGGRRCEECRDGIHLSRDGSRRVPVEESIDA